MPDYERWTRNRPDHASFAILLQTLCVIDVDSAAVAAELEHRFPVLATVPRERTPRGGMHYYFRRSELADSGGYYDSRSPVMPSVDFKSRTSTGSGGIVLVAPTAGYTWIQQPCGPPQPIPDDLLRAIAAPKHAEHHVAFECRGGEVMECESRIAYTSPYIRMFIDKEVAGDVAMVLVPLFSAAAVRFAIEAMDSRTLGAIDREVSDEALAFIDFADFDKASVKWFTETLSEREELSRVHPAMASAVVTDELVAIDSALAGRTVHDPNIIDDLNAEGCALEMGRPRRTSPSPITPDPVYALESGLPARVKEWMRAFPGELIIAGGCVTGAIATGAPLGWDIDLFVVAQDTATGDRILDHILDDEDIIEARNTGYAMTMILEVEEVYTLTISEVCVQVILVLNPTVESTVRGFDLAPSAACAYYVQGGDALVIRATASWLESIRSNAFPILSASWTDSSIMRVAKYSDVKGFVPYIAGLDRAKVDNYTHGRLDGWCPERALRDAIRDDDGPGALFLVEKLFRVRRSTNFKRLTTALRKARVSDYTAFTACTNAIAAILERIFCRSTRGGCDVRAQPGDRVPWRAYAPESTVNGKKSCADPALGPWCKSEARWCGAVE